MWEPLCLETAWASTTWWYTDSSSFYLSFNNDWREWANRFPVGIESERVPFLHGNWPDSLNERCMQQCFVWNKNCSSEWAAGTVLGRVTYYFHLAGRRASLEESSPECNQQYNTSNNPVLLSIHYSQHYLLWEKSTWGTQAITKCCLLEYDAAHSGRSSPTFWRTVLSSSSELKCEPIKQRAFLAYSSTLKIEVTRFSETSVALYQDTDCYIPEESTLETKKRYETCSSQRDTKITVSYHVTTCRYVSRFQNYLLLPPSEQNNSTLMMAARSCSETPVSDILDGVTSQKANLGRMLTLAKK
jgi:hypothetical protein